MKERFLEREYLDELPPDDPGARGSRRDLERLNAWMGNARRAARVLSPALAGATTPRVVELGCGDGKFLVSVMARLPRVAHGSVLLLDRFDLMDVRTSARLGGRGWTAQPVQADVLAWLKQPRPGRFEAILANLFLHHFADDLLRELLGLTAERANMFVAVEPRRSRVALTLSRLVGLIGCNAVTRHDAPASVRAGFQGAELSALWPANGPWSLEEREAGWCSHLFVARRHSEGGAS